MSHESEPKLGNGAWNTLREALQELDAICLTEQEALVTLDGKELARVLAQKQQAVTRVVECLEPLRTRRHNGAPREVAEAVRSCHRTNSWNRDMLTRTVQYLESVLTAPPRRTAHARRTVDTRV